MKNYGCIACCRKKQAFESDTTLNKTVHSELDTKTVNSISSKSYLKKYAQKFYNIIVLDFTSVQFIDEASCKCLKEVIKEYKTDEVKILFTNCDGKFHIFLIILKNFVYFVYLVSIVFLEKTAWLNSWRKWTATTANSMNSYF